MPLKMKIHDGTSIIDHINKINSIINWQSSIKIDYDEKKSKHYL